MKFRSAPIAAIAALSASAALAAPFSVSAPDRAAPGDSIDISLIDELTSNLEAASLHLSFDSAVLAFDSAQPGQVTAGFSLLGSPGIAGDMFFSLATPGLPVDGARGSLIDVKMKVLPGAPLGSTPVSFDSFLPDYDVPLTSANVLVQQVPDAPTVWLMLLGLGGLAGGRALRRGVCVQGPTKSWT